MDAGERLCRAERGRLDDLTERIAAMRRLVAAGPGSPEAAGVLSPKKAPEPLTKDAVKSELQSSISAGLLAQCPHCGGAVARGMMEAHILACPSAPTIAGVVS